MLTDRLRARAASALGAGAALLVGGVLWLVDPSRHRIPLCPLHALTGLWCPLCGSTRAVHALLHADLATAVADNALFVLALPVLAGLWWRRRTSGRGLPRPVWWAVVVVVLAFGVFRNLPAGSWLAPPG